MKYTLLHTAAYPVTSVAAALASEGVTAKLVHEPTDLTGTDQPTAFLLDPSSRSSFSVVQLRRFIQAGGAVVLLGAVDEHDVPDAVPDDVVSAYVTYPYAPRRLLVGLRTAYAEAAARRDAFQVRREAALRSKELRELTRIGMALTTERDYNTLLELILSLALQITDSDAASLYIVERPEDEPQRLRFKLSQNVSRPDIPFVEFTMPLDMQSIAGNVAVTGQPLAIDDVYDLPGDVEYTFNRSFDEQYGYRSKSMLTIPMKDHKEEIIGVLQLINRKRHGDQKLAEPRDFERGVVPYSHRQVDLVSALAGQAAVSIENSQLYEDIERLFEGFVRASVTAIEQRDPTTFGHSGRVASMTVALAETVDRSDDGPYRHVAFSREDVRQIRYAGLLHDFGKVGVREQVLVKAKKLYPSDLALLKQRYAFIRRTAESDFHRQRADYLEQHGQRGYGDFATRLRHDYDMRLAELDEFIQLVLKSNEPTVLPEGSFESLQRWANTHYEDLDGNLQPFIRDDEIRFLSIRKGSLDQTERLEIESHVTHTYHFLLQIPWTKELKFIPTIAYGHHEKLDGSGYPRQVEGEHIPIQTRMMTIADIFDALTAADRPYKRAVPASRALDILTAEAGAGMLDESLFALFVASRVFERASETGNPMP
ncbi:MAG: GAF domain-containing protein [Gemmatimonadota bacterium]|nr:GAF domain-containing protein [Gemmatimonadota bacterium]